MYKKITVKSISYWSWVKLIFISVLPIFMFAFFSWSLSSFDIVIYLKFVISVLIGCFISGFIAKVGMFLILDSVDIKVDVSE